MSKKDFIALADMIIRINRSPCHGHPFTEDQIKALAEFCSYQNSRFDRERWVSYINGKCGPNGGKSMPDTAYKSVLVHSFVQRHLVGGADNYAIALLLEKAGYTFRDLSDALIACRGM